VFLKKLQAFGLATRRRQILLLLLVSTVLCGLVLAAGYWGQAPPSTSTSGPARVEVAINISTPTPVPTFTSTPRPSSTPTPPATPLPPTPTNTRVVPVEVYAVAPTEAARRATAQAEGQATAVAQLQRFRQKLSPSLARSAPAVSHSLDARLVLAHYFAWYDGHGWDDCNISAGDKPLEPYHSDDPEAIARHIELALDAGLNGFTLHWFTSGDRTDRNFRTLLNRSEGVNFTSTVVFSRHFWPGSPGPNRQNIVEALRYIGDQYSHHPNFLRVADKPVIFFIDVYRVPTGAGQTPQQFWAAVRNQVDPNRQAWWIAEGLDPSYLSVFDGLYVFKISHAAYPHDYEKSPRWGAQVRRWAAQAGQPKLWLATISPGWDDLRASCRQDVRVPNTPHRLERAGGAVYEATFKAAIESKPDWLIVSSFNEWVEGSYIEPSLLYGDKYLEMTHTFGREFQRKW
jgi:hypothetical protein